MNVDDNDCLQFDELLNRSYAPLRQPWNEQRESLLTAFSQTRATVPAAAKESWKMRRVWLATAASILVMVGIDLFMNHASSGIVYGLEAVPERILQVDSISIRGWQMVYDDAKTANPPMRVPVEYLIRRPDKFRVTWVGASYGKGPPDVRHGLNICDGRRNLQVSETQKECVGGPIAPLNARLQTELLAQQFILTAVLGAPGAPYRKIGTETINGRKCEIYEGRFDEYGNTTVSTLWFDPASGYPLKVTHDEILANGTRRRESELNEISVNAPIPDERFQFEAPKDYKTVITEVKNVDERTRLDLSPIGSSSGGGTELETWQALRISDDAALLVWRRSPPEPNSDGRLDWLANLEMTLPRLNEDSKLRHHWVHLSNSSEGWNWSLVAVPRGQSLGRGEIHMTLRAKKCRLTQGMVALRLPDQDLEQVLREALGAMLADEIPKPSLAQVREQAKKLSKAKEID